MAQLRDLLSDPNAEAKAREQLQFLQNAATSKLKLYKSELDNMFLNPEAVGKVQIVGNRAMRYYEEYRVDVSEGASSKISDVVNNFFKGSSDTVKQGFATLIELSLQSILGNTSAGEQEVQSFYVIIENNAFVRVDAKYWRYNFSQDGIIGNHKNAFCYMFCKSIVDYKKLTLGELVYLISEAAQGKDIHGFIEEIKKVWKEVEQFDPVTVHTNYLMHEARLTAMANQKMVKNIGVQRTMLMQPQEIRTFEASNLPRTLDFFNHLVPPASFLVFQSNNVANVLGAGTCPALTAVPNFVRVNVPANTPVTVLCLNNPLDVRYDWGD